MAKKEVTNISASVKEKLLNHSRENSRDFNSVLLQYLHERFLFRISKSVYSNNFVLKGALLFLAYDISRLRPTKDIDLLGTSVPNKIDSIKKIFQEIVSYEFDDGVIFDPTSFKTEEIIEHDEYNGIRVKLFAKLGTVRQQIQIDIGFGDVIFPQSLEIDYPTILDSEAVLIQNTIRFDF